MQNIARGLRGLISRKPAVKTNSSGLVRGSDIVSLMGNTQPAPFSTEIVDPFVLQATKSLGYNRFVTDFINDTGRGQYYDMSLLEGAYRTSVFLFASMRKAGWLLSQITYQVERRQNNQWTVYEKANPLQDMLDRDSARINYDGYMNLALYGNALMYKRKTRKAVINNQRGERNPYSFKSGGVSGLHVIPGSKFQVDWDGTSGEIRGFFLSQVEETVLKNTNYLDRNEAVYHTDYDPRDEYKGTSMVQVAINDAYTDASIRQWAGQYFMAGALPLVLVSYEGNPNGVTESDLRKYKYALEDQWRGVGSAFKSAFMDRPVNVQTVGVEADKVAAPELSRTALEGITAAFGLPADLVVPPAGGSDNARHKYLMKQVYTDTIIPIASQFATALNQDLGLPDGWRIVVNENEISVLDADRTENAQTEQGIYQGGLETVGEARNKLNMPETPFDDWWWQDGKAMSPRRVQRRDEYDIDLMSAALTAWNDNGLTRRQYYDMIGLPMPEGYKDGFKFEVVVEGSGGTALGTAILDDPDDSGPPDGNGPVIPDSPPKPGEVTQSEPGQPAEYKPEEKPAQSPQQAAKEIREMAPAAPPTEEAELLNKIRPGAQNPRPGRAAIKPQTALTPEEALVERKEVWLPMAKAAGNEAGINWEQTSLPHFRRALEAELTERQHGGIANAADLAELVPEALTRLKRETPEIETITIDVPFEEAKPEDRAKWVTAVIRAGRLGTLPAPGDVPDRLLECLTSFTDDLADEATRESILNAVRQAIFAGWFDDRLAEVQWYNPLNLYLIDKAQQEHTQAELQAWEKVAKKSTSRAAQFEHYHTPDAIAGLIRQGLESVDNTPAVKALFGDIRQQIAAGSNLNETAKAYAGFIGQTTPVWTAQERETRQDILADTYRQEALQSIKRYDWTAQSYKANLYNLLSQLFQVSPDTGNPPIERNKAAEQARRLVSVHLQAAFEDGLEVAGGVKEELAEDQQESIKSFIQSERKLMTKFIREIYGKAVPMYREVLALNDDIQMYKADPAKRGELQQQLLQKLKEFETLRDKTVKRLETWISKGAKQIHQVGVLAAKANQRLEWVWNPQKEHCRTCAVANGQIHLARHWERYGLRPQGDKLECGGFNCGCKFEPTTVKSRGRMDRIPLVAAGKSHSHDESMTIEEAISYAKSIHADDKSMVQYWSNVTKSVPQKYEGIDFKPTEAMADNAKRALERREELPESKRGMTDTGIARARDIQNRRNLSPETWREMNAWFSRHQETSRESPNYDKRERAWVAWQGWGGDEGKSRASSIVSQMDTADKKEKE